VPDARPWPLLAYWLRRSPRAIAFGGPAKRHEGLVVVYARAALAKQFSLTFPVIPPAGRDALPAGGRPVAQNASWLSVEDC
jgi:hypothetical protein